MIERLERAGVRAALGGSGLLNAVGIEGSIGDWDLTTDDPVERVRDAIADLEHEFVGPNGIHADHKFRVERGEIEIIVRFSILAEGAAVRIPTRVTGHWSGVPLGSPEAWAVAYRLLGRDAKSESLFHLLETRGVDPETLRHLLGEPLPADLALRLQALPTTRPFK